MRTLSEYETRIFDVVPGFEQHRIVVAGALAEKVRIRWLDHRRAEVTATQWIGTADIPGIGPLRIVPKLAGTDLDVLAMIAVADANSPTFLETLHHRFATGPRDTLPELIARFLTDGARTIHREGLLAGYRPARDDLPFVRGRIDIQQQTLRRFSRLDSLACTFEELDADILENQLIAAALRIARTIGTDPARRRSTTHLYDHFAAAAPTRPPDPYTARTQLLHYNRHNERYRATLTWALALLDHNFIDNAFVSGHTRAEAFLIDMNRLFERFVTELVRRCLPTGYTQRSQASDSTFYASDGGGYAIRPDILVTARDRSAAIDSKYKRYDTGPLSISDLYQLTVYAQAYPGWNHVPRSLLIHPSVAPHPPRMIVFRPRGIATAEVTMLPIQPHAVIDSLTGGDPHPMEYFTRAIRQWLANDADGCDN